MPELAAFSLLIGAAKSADLRGAPGFFMETFVILIFAEASIAQLGERQTEDLKVPGSIPGLGMSAMLSRILEQGRTWGRGCAQQFDFLQLMLEHAPR